MGQRVFGDEIIAKIPVLKDRGSDKDFSSYGISDKELEIITKVAEGLSNKEISEVLF